MSEFIDLLKPTAREQSILIWISIGLVIGLSQKDIRDCLKNVFKAFLNRKIQVMVWFSLVWTTLSCIILWYFDSWDKTLLKETIVWAISSGVVFTFSAVSKKDTTFFQVLSDNFKISALLAFFVNIYSFDLWVELIIFPIMTFVVLMNAVAQVKDELKDSRTITSALVVVFSFIYFCFSVWLFIARISPGQFFSEFLKVFFPIVLYILVSFPCL